MIGLGELGFWILYLLFAIPITWQLMRIAESLTGAIHDFIAKHNGVLSKTDSGNKTFTIQKYSGGVLILVEGKE